MFKGVGCESRMQQFKWWFFNNYMDSPLNNQQFCYVLCFILIKCKVIQCMIVYNKFFKQLNNVRKHVAFENIGF